MTKSKFNIQQGLNALLPGGAGGAGAGGAGGAGANLNLIPEELEFSSPALLKKFWWISLYVTNDAIAKL